MEDHSRELQEINKRLVAHDNKFNEICSELRSALSERHGQGAGGSGQGATVVLDIAAAPIQQQQQPAMENANLAPVPGSPAAKKSRNGAGRKLSNDANTRSNSDRSAGGMLLRRSRRLGDKSAAVAVGDDDSNSKSATDLAPIIEEKQTLGKRRRRQCPAPESDEDVALVVGLSRKRERK